MNARKQGKPMTRILITRRTTLLGLVATIGIGLYPRTALANTTAIRVVKDPNCGYCSA